MSHTNWDRKLLDRRFAEALLGVEELEANLENARGMIGDQAMELMDVKQQRDDLIEAAKPFALVNIEPERPSDEAIYGLVGGMRFAITYGDMRQLQSTVVRVKEEIDIG